MITCWPKFLTTKSHNTFQEAATECVSLLMSTSLWYYWSIKLALLVAPDIYGYGCVLVTPTTQPVFLICSKVILSFWSDVLLSIGSPWLRAGTCKVTKPSALEADLFLLGWESWIGTTQLVISWQFDSPKLYFKLDTSVAESWSFTKNLT